MPVARAAATLVGMTHTTDECIFCDIVAGEHRASIVHEDETAVAFMDRYPVVRGHLLVVPRVHAVGFEDLDRDVGAHLWSVGHDLARTLRRSSVRCEGVNFLVCDGTAAFQTIFHFHLHVIPRYVDDGWSLTLPEPGERDRTLLDDDASAIRAAIG